MKISSFYPPDLWKLSSVDKKKYAALTFSTLLIFDQFYGRQWVWKSLKRYCIDRLYPPMRPLDFSENSLERLAEKLGGYGTLQDRIDCCLDDFIQEHEDRALITSILISKVLYNRQWLANLPRSRRISIDSTVVGHAYNFAAGMHYGQEERGQGSLKELIMVLFPIVRDLSKSGVLNSLIVRFISLLYKHLPKGFSSITNNKTREYNALKKVFSDSRPSFYDFLELVIIGFICLSFIKAGSSKLSSKDYLCRFPPTEPFSLDRSHFHSHLIPVDASKDIDAFLENTQLDTLFLSFRDEEETLDALLCSDRKNRITNCLWLEVAPDLFFLDFSQINLQGLFNPLNQKKWRCAAEQLKEKVRLSSDPVLVLYRKDLDKLIDKNSKSVNKHFIKIFYDMLSSFKAGSEDKGRVIICFNAKKPDKSELNRIFEIRKHSNLWGKYMIRKMQLYSPLANIQKILRNSEFHPYIPLEAWMDESKDAYWQKLLEIINKKIENSSGITYEELEAFLKEKLKAFKEKLHQSQEEANQEEIKLIDSLKGKINALGMTIQKTREASLQQVYNILPISSCKHLQTLIEEKETEKILASIFFKENILIPLLQRKQQSLQSEIRKIRSDHQHLAPVDFHLFLDKQ